MSRISAGNLDGNLRGHLQQVSDLPAAGSMERLETVSTQVHCEPFSEVTAPENILQLSNPSEVHRISMSTDPAGVPQLREDRLQEMMR